MDSKAEESKEESKDEVDFIPTSVAKTEICVPFKSFNPLNKTFLVRNSHSNNNNHTPKTPQTTMTTTTIKTSLFGDCEIQAGVKPHISPFERLQLFHFSLRKKSEVLEKSPLPQPTTKDHRPRLIKSSSIARLFGNTYNTKKSEESHAANITALKKSESVSEKFSNKSKESDDEFTFRMDENHLILSESSMNLNSLDSSSAPMEKSNMKKIRSITKGLGKLLRRSSDSAAISAPDPEYKVFYLGNVLTGWAKGDSCIDKPLATLWRNYTQNNRPQVLMRLQVCSSGLKATTRQHGLTEYWSHRISFCSAPQTYPKIFCWIYRHEGRKMKHELRCHAVICSKDAQCQEIATLLKHNLTIALREFKREKINKQNARLSLANAASENPSMPYRKILLSTGGSNYKPPLERSKSAPKLCAIEEIIDEEEDEEDCDEEMKVRRQEEKKKQSEMKSCCKEDYLYPSVTLGRRRCRRGHSIRKSRLLRNSILNTQNSYPPSNAELKAASIATNETPEVAEDESLCKSIESDFSVSSVPNQEAQRKSLGSDEDFESFLLYNNYDSKEPLSVDLLSYFDMHLQTPNTSMMTSSATMSMSDLCENDMSLKNQRNSMSMSDLIDYQSDNELDDGEPFSGNYNFNQDSLLETLRQQSELSKDETDLHQQTNPIHETSDSVANVEEQNVQSSENFVFNKQPTCVEHDDDLTSEAPSSLCISEKTICVTVDSDEGSSISSGCETSSTVTAMADEAQLPRRGSVLDRVRNFEQMADSQKYQDIPVKLKARGVKCPLPNMSPSTKTTFITKNGTLTKAVNGNPLRVARTNQEDDSDELSDESGYVEFQDISLKSFYA